MADTYVIKTLNDLLKVPAERRAALLKELEQSLLVYELAWGDSDPDTHVPMVLTWTDDGCKDTTLLNPDGETVLSLKITEGEKPAANAVQLGPKLFEFYSFSNWVNHAQTAWKRSGVSVHHTLCIDAKGRHCHIGRDFMTARDDGSFPVAVHLRRVDLQEVVHADQA